MDVVLLLLYARTGESGVKLLELIEVVLLLEIVILEVVFDNDVVVFAVVRLRILSQAWLVVFKI